MWYYKMRSHIIESGTFNFARLRQPKTQDAQDRQKVAQDDIKEKLRGLHSYSRYAVLVTNRKGSK